MSLTKLWIHLIISTKNRKRFILPVYEKVIYKIILERFHDMKIHVEEINRMEDHVHLLFLLNPSYSMAEVVKNVKGTSTYLINRDEITPDRFSWSKGYAAFAVSESEMPKAKRYIQNQKQHHQKLNTNEEYTRFLKVHGLEEFVPHNRK